MERNVGNEGMNKRHCNMERRQDSLLIARSRFYTQSANRNNEHKKEQDEREEHDHRSDENGRQDDGNEMEYKKDVHTPNSPKSPSYHEDIEIVDNNNTIVPMIGPEPLSPGDEELMLAANRKVPLVSGQRLETSGPGTIVQGVEELGV